MNESRPYQKSPWRPMLTILLLVAVVPLLLCGGVLTWFFGRQAAAAREVAQRTADLQSRGAPIDDESLSALHRSITTDRNAKRWVAVGEQMESTVFSDSCRGIPYFDTRDAHNQPTTVPPPGTPWPNRPDIEAFLHRWALLRSEIHELATAELDNHTAPLRRPIEFNSFLTLLPDTQRARDFARMIAVEHDLAVHDRDGDRAFACIQSARGVQRSFDGEPLLVSQLVALAIGDMTNGMIQRSIEYDLFSDDELTTINDNIPTFDQLVSNYRMAIQGERASALPLYSDPDKARDMLELDGVSAKGYEAFTKLRSRDALLYLKLMEAYETVPASSMAEFREGGMQIETDFTVDLQDDSTVEKLDKMFTALLLPALGAMSGAIVRAEESNRLARLAITLRLFQHRLDRWPNTLDALSEIDVDPAALMPSGKRPFGYRADEDDVVIWGTDRKVLGEIPDDPPEVVDDEDPQKRWVWRLRAVAP